MKILKLPFILAQLPIPELLFTPDDELPDWLHTLLLAILVSPPAIWLFWFGFSALFSGRLEPLPGPDFGQYFFGPNALLGKPARIAGISLITLGFAYLAIAAKFSRFAEEGKRWRYLPWLLIGVAILLAKLVKH